MAMGGRKREQQATMWVDVQVVSETPARPFYERLHELLTRHGFDDFLESA